MKSKQKKESKSKHHQRGALMFALSLSLVPNVLSGVGRCTADERRGQKHSSQTSATSVLANNNKKVQRGAVGQTNERSTEEDEIREWSSRRPAVRQRRIVSLLFSSAVFSAPKESRARRLQSCFFSLVCPSSAPHSSSPLLAPLPMPIVAPGLRSSPSSSVLLFFFTSSAPSKREWIACSCAGAGACQHVVSGCRGVLRYSMMDTGCLLSRSRDRECVYSR